MKIDVRAAIRSKSPKLAKIIPSFIISCIEKLIHQDEMNAFIERHKNDTPIAFATAGLREVSQVTYSAVNKDNIPKIGRSIIVSNHPLGGIDGLALIALMGKYRTDIKFPVNDLLMQLNAMHGVFIPVNKHGRNQSQVVNMLNSAFESEDLIIYFPAGLCSRKKGKDIYDLEWKKTIITKAKQYKRDIIPVFFDGKNSNRFYNLANWRKKLGIKVNIEMLFLPDEFFRQKGNHFTIIFGTKISYQSFNNTKTDSEWSEWLKKQVYALRNH